MNGLECWAEEEFGDSDLGDLRRTKRAVELAAVMAARPGGRVTSVVQNSAEREGAFRLLCNRAVDEKELAQQPLSNTSAARARRRLRSCR